MLTAHDHFAISVWDDGSPVWTNLDVFKKGVGGRRVQETNLRFSDTDEIEDVILMLQQAVRRHQKAEKRLP
jgi:hypothetical protein